MIPGKPESFYEIGYMLYARPSIFAISFILCINSAGMVTAYFYIFGDTFATLVVDIFGIGNPEPEGFLKYLGYR